MPYDYDKRKRRYKSPDGSYVTREELRALIDKLTLFVTKRTASIARKFDAGTITAAEFNELMREVLKAGHIVASSVGRGGRAMMDSADWLRVARKLKWQYGYLSTFSAKLAKGTLKTANTASRAKAYVNAIFISYAESFHIAQTEFVEGGKNSGILARLVQNSAEGCPECSADAALGWQPVEELAEIGDRICESWCRCDLEFSDLEGNEV